MAKTVEPDPYFPEDEEPKPEEVKPPEPEKVSRKKHSTPDGPRYTVGLRSETDPCCYKDIFETEKLQEAKEKAQEAVAKYGRGVSVWDRTACPSLVERYEPPKSEEEIAKEAATTETKKKKGVKRK